jgi:alginate O-acetyltransferase complex protein AlgI
MSKASCTMNFSSPRFVIFFGLLLLALAPRYDHRRKKQVLAAASCLFYAAWDWRYLGLLILVSAIDYVAAARIVRSDSETVRRRWLIASVASNLGILGYFKYSDFFIANLNGAFGPWMQTSIPALNLLLPAGISFYTFKSMSYTIDVHKRHIVPVNSWLDYTMFITFFPELVAGPIVRASVFLPQLDRRIGPDKGRLLVGANIFLLGLLKKRLIADRMAEIADPVFASPESYSATTLWLSVVAYTIQIYCDFSGYSDMAIGAAKMLGYDLPENFAMPYASRDITEFWRRWHITLSTWLRDYLYISLGGNRRGMARTYVNLMVTMLLGGLWHGASWNFVAWGACHGAALAAHRWLKERFGKQFRVPWVLSWALTLGFVMLTWIPFRAPTFAATRVMLQRMFTAEGGAIFWPEHLIWAVPIVVAAHCIGWLLVRETGRPEFERSRGLLWRILDVEAVGNEVSGTYAIFHGRTVASAFVLVFSLAVLFYYGAAANSPFIYFQF